MSADSSKSPGRAPASNALVAAPDGPSASVRKPRKRSPGRRSRQDAADLRAQLLDAALACFVAKGIAGTSLRDIARHAGVTPALVHYYFGDKPQLQQAVVEERLWPVMEQLHGGVREAADDLQGLVAAFVGGVVSAVAAHPWLPTLWVREILCEGGALRDVMIERVGPMLPRMVVERFTVAQRSGQLNAELDPRLMVVSLVGLTLFPLASAPIWQQLVGAANVGAEDVQRHALALLMHGLELKG